MENDLRGQVKTVLTIAGSDCSGGAGIQADLKTIFAHGLYGMSVITALTAQNTCGVYAIQNALPGMIGAQLHAVLEDIPPDAIKIGMLAGKQEIFAVSENLHKLKNKVPMVIDPVMAATSGGRLLQEDAISVLEKELFPLASLLTPNLPEAEALCGFSIKRKEEMEKAASVLYERTGSAVLVKGGHLQECADDLLLTDDGQFWFPGRKILTFNTHGTGCTLSSAIACNLALKKSLPEAVQAAKIYVENALHAGLDLGSGSGPLWHAVSVNRGGEWS